MGRTSKILLQHAEFHHEWFLCSFLGCFSGFFPGTHMPRVLGNVALLHQQLIEPQLRLMPLLQLRSIHALAALPWTWPGVQIPSAQGIPSLVPSTQPQDARTTKVSRCQEILRSNGGPNRHSLVIACHGLVIDIMI